MKYRFEIEWRERQQGKDVRLGATVRVEAPTIEEAERKMRVLHGSAVVIVECVRLPSEAARA